MPHLDLEEFEPKNSLFVTHFLDSFEAIGGWKGILFISIGVISFYYFVDYSIKRGKRKRAEALKRKSK
jgi:hypothetical protein